MLQASTAVLRPRSAVGEAGWCSDASMLYILRAASTAGLVVALILACGRCRHIIRSPRAFHLAGQFLREACLQSVASQALRKHAS